MTTHRVIAVVVGFTMAGLLAIICLARTGRRPPVLNVVQVEPAGVFDASGSEMCLMTLSLSNSASGPYPEDSLLFVKDGRIDAKVANRWVPTEAALTTLAACRLPAGQQYEWMLVLPAATDVCRIRYKYTGAHLTKGRLSWVAEHLPLVIRFRIPHAFWRWVGFPGHRPSSLWREESVELPVHSAPLPRQEVLPRGRPLKWLPRLRSA